MATPSRKDVTDLLIDWGQGDQEALKTLMPLVYDELHRLASRYLRHERPGHTLQTTALVHEAYLRVVSGSDEQGPPQLWQNRGHFFGAAALAMRRILVERARHRKRFKHGGGRDLGQRPPRRRRRHRLQPARRHGRRR